VFEHAARSVPWGLVATAAALVTVLLRVVEEWPYQMWPLQGIAVGLVAGVAASAFDEPAAAVVDTLPRSLRWRTVARSAAVVLLLGWWLLSVWWTRTAYFGHAEAVAWQGCVAALAATAYVTWLRDRGRATPAAAVSPAVVGVTISLALARPLDESVPLFPYTAGGPWASSQLLWSTVGVLALVTLTWVLVPDARIKSPCRGRPLSAPGSR